ncbi:hypothetical protein [Anatilimnocola floriformis]|uniref:hypothetical protein n=1 Tax=Anatilimnocola floriformis TaxID=2948575 RepID=UPI0020C5A7D6|nr:hypothetical protein [Anatilimnocola floriformis]
MNRRDFFRLTVAAATLRILPTVSPMPPRKWYWSFDTRFLTVLVTSPELTIEDLRFLYRSRGRLIAHPVFGFEPGELVLLSTHGACTSSRQVGFCFRRAEPFERERFQCRGLMDIPTNVAHLLGVK